MAERPMSQDTPMTISRSSGVSGGVSSATSGHLAAARANSRVRGVGSFLGAARGSSLMSNDADEGGRFIRSGPDGMGGEMLLIHDCMLLLWSNDDVCNLALLQVAVFPLTILLLHALACTGIVHICVQAEKSGASMLRGSERPIQSAIPRSIACNPVGVPVARSKRPHSNSLQPANSKSEAKREAPKKQRPNNISSFFGPSTSKVGDPK